MNFLFLFDLYVHIIHYHRKNISIKPIMAYDVETRAGTTRTKSLLRSTEMKTLRNAVLTIKDPEILGICDVVCFFPIDNFVQWGRNRRPYFLFITDAFVEIILLYSTYKIVLSYAGRLKDLCGIYLFISRQNRLKDFR